MDNTVIFRRIRFSKSTLKFIDSDILNVPIQENQEEYEKYFNMITPVLNSYYSVFIPENYSELKPVIIF